MSAKRAPINYQKKYNMTASEYVKIKQIRDNAPGMIKDGKMLVLWEGEWILESEFKEMFPIPQRLYMAKENPDKRKDYLK
jgi:hypothetical protein